MSNQCGSASSDLPRAEGTDVQPAVVQPVAAPTLRWSLAGVSSQSTRAPSTTLNNNVRTADAQAPGSPIVLIGDSYELETRAGLKRTPSVAPVSSSARRPSSASMKSIAGRSGGGTTTRPVNALARKT